MPELQLWDEDKHKALLTLPLHEELQGLTPYPQLLILPQSQTERLLYQALARESCAELRFNHQITHISQQPSHVAVHYTNDGVEGVAEGEWLVGCDGAHSCIRQSINSEFLGSTFPFKAALADIKIRSNEPLHSPRLTSVPKFAVGIKMTANVWRLILPFSDRDDMSLMERAHATATSLFPNMDHELIWHSEFSLHTRIATSFVRHRVVLAGDAAHLNSPVGGQGMNAGIGDSAVLAPALIKALRDQDSGPVEKYGEQRRKMIESGVNRFTGMLTRVLLLNESRYVRVVFTIVAAIIRIAPLRHKLIRRLAMLD